MNSDDYGLVEVLNCAELALILISTTLCFLKLLFN